MTNETKLVCLKCGGDMRTYERNGITIDQCEECRGIFLDRGELERLIGAESAYLAGHADSRSRHDSPTRKSKKSRGGFLGELFD